MYEKVNIPAGTSVRSLLSEIMPQMTKKTLAVNNTSKEMSGTEIRMMIDTGSDVYSYILKDGTQVEVMGGGLDGAMLKLIVSTDDVERMIKSGNLDMLLGIQSDINISKYNALKSLKGSFIAEIADTDHTYKIKAILNGAESPLSVFKMSMNNSAALMRKETNPIQLFMSGALKIEGDMVFAMSTQPLFA
jgi:hypothetical protein